MSRVFAQDSERERLRRESVGAILDERNRNIVQELAIAESGRAEDRSGLENEKLRRQLPFIERREEAEIGLSNAQSRRWSDLSEIERRRIALDESEMVDVPGFGRVKAGDLLKEYGDRQRDKMQSDYRRAVINDRRAKDERTLRDDSLKAEQLITKQMDERGVKLPPEALIPYTIEFNAKSSLPYVYVYVPGIDRTFPRSNIPSKIVKIPLPKFGDTIPKARTVFDAMAELGYSDIRDYLREFYYPNIGLPIPPELE